jgi:hypothetical protein
MVGLCGSGKTLLGDCYPAEVSLIPTSFWATVGNGPSSLALQKIKLRSATRMWPNTRSLEAHFCI